MRTTLLYSWLLVCCLFVFSNCSRAQSYGAQYLPDFTFEGMNGKLFTKANVDKTKTSIFIFFDVTCEHCQHEIVDIGKNYASFKNVRFYLVSMDNKNSIMQFISTYGKQLYGKPNVTILQDFKPEFVQKFRPEKFPALFIYSKSGELIKYLSGQKKAKDILAVLK